MLQHLPVKIEKKRVDELNCSFTLIELLIVVAIIAILAVIIVINLNNALSNARDARRTEDASNISKALTMYTVTEIILIKALAAIMMKAIAAILPLGGMRNQHPAAAG